MGHVNTPSKEQDSIEPYVQQSTVRTLDVVLVSTVLIYAVVIVIFILFGRFTMKLIKQHYDIYPLLYDIEEAEKKKREEQG